MKELFIAFGGRRLESVSVSGTVSVSGRATMPGPRLTAGTPSGIVGIDPYGDYPGSE
jgi:hypothetical protein